MSFSGVFAIGLSGINAFTTSLESVSDNIANTQTTAFKRTRTDFSTLITQEAAGGAGISAGGVEAVNRQLVSEQGAITRTGSNTDLAISGSGFFVVSDDINGSVQSFTRAGGFTVQPDGALKNAAGYYLQAAPVSGGALSAVSLGSLETVDINSIEGLAQATSALSIAGNLDARAPIGEAVTQYVQIYEADGAARTVAFTFTKIGANQWAADASFNDGAFEPIANGVISFDVIGDFDAAASSFPAALSIPSSSGQTIDIDMARLNGAGRTSNLTAIQSGGAPFGALSGVEISRDGRITALFANGLRQDLYQIVLANFINPEGLDDGKNSTYLINDAAGGISLDIPQTGRAGAIESAALEISTVDIGQEFSRLIETQRAYAANSRIISVADELWRTLTQTAS